MTMSLIETDISPSVARAAQPADQVALFLDFDGTLVEIAPLPDAVQLDRRIAAALAALRARLDGALALVSGRPIAFLDEVMAPHRFDAAGLHGAQIRFGETIETQSGSPNAMREATRDLVRFANSHVGIIVEDKRISVALHWRLAPQLKDEALELIRAHAAQMGPSVRLQEGKSVAELVPATASKGEAIRRLMQMAPYAGRMPVFIGDDITDEDGFKAVNGLGGLSVRIGDGETCATRRVASPTELRTILLAAAENGGLSVSNFSQG